MAFVRVEHGSRAIVLTSARLRIRCVDVCSRYGIISLRHRGGWDKGTRVALRYSKGKLKADMG